MVAHHGVTANGYTEDACQLVDAIRRRNVFAQVLPTEGLASGECLRMRLALTAPMTVSQLTWEGFYLPLFPLYLIPIPYARTCVSLRGRLKVYHGNSAVPIASYDVDGGGTYWSSLYYNSDLSKTEGVLTFAYFDYVCGVAGPAAWGRLRQQVLDRLESPEFASTLEGYMSEPARR